MVWLTSSNSLILFASIVSYEHWRVKATMSWATPFSWSSGKWNTTLKGSLFTNPNLSYLFTASSWWKDGLGGRPPMIRSCIAAPHFLQLLHLWSDSLDLKPPKAPIKDDLWGILIISISWPLQLLEKWLLSCWNRWILYPCTSVHLWVELPSKKLSAGLNSCDGDFCISRLTRRFILLVWRMSGKLPRYTTGQRHPRIFRWKLIPYKI